MYTNNNRVESIDQVLLYLYALRLSPVKTVNPYSIYSNNIYSLFLMCYSKRRLIHATEKWIDRLFDLTSYNFDHIFTFTWTIEFAEINPLPASK